VLAAALSTLLHKTYCYTCCLPCSAPTPYLRSIALPAPPPGSAYTSDNGCNVAGGNVTSGVACTADCLPGYTTGGMPMPTHVMACGGSPPPMVSGAVWTDMLR
jgi:hypothetical protein